MPIIKNSSYQAPPFFKNGHVSTIIPSLFRKISGVHYQRERFILSDNDFLDLDWLNKGNKKLVIIAHGLEGSSERHYVMGTAGYFYARGWDALAWNCRSCSGEMNKLPRFYHHGATEDLNEVIQYVQAAHQYHTIWLVGFSMGGSLTLKFLGEQSHKLASIIRGGVVFSVPCNLKSSVDELNRSKNGFYRNRFLKKLGKKIREKAQTFPDLISYEGFEKIRYFQEFDNRYTAPLHGFKDADDFYATASAEQYIPDIKVPTLIVNAMNDPFLPEACYPFQQAANHQYVFLETPERGGHVGFPMHRKEPSWMERRAFEFITSHH